MSEFINNESMKRQELLKKIIKSLHAGVDIEDAKKEFKKHFEEVSTKEISQMEHALIQEGMKIEEVQNLCDVHAALFDGSISDIHRTKDHTQTPGHPVQVFMVENDRIEQLIKEEIDPFIDASDKTSNLMLRVGLDRLLEIDKHYKRKEYLFFPNLEKKGIDSIPKVMWAVDDEVRNELKSCIKALSEIKQDAQQIRIDVKKVVAKTRDMISKENNILLPLLVETLSFFDWILVDSSSEEIGYFLEKPKASWKKENKDNEEEQALEDSYVKGEVKFDAGSLTPDVLNQMLNTLPLDMTFIDHEGHVKYFSQGTARIFDRPKTIIGRHVNMCHPPQSVHVVEDIVASFRSGEKDHEDFWIRMKDMFVYIRYFAVRSKTGEYLGTLEVTQDIKPIVELEGEKRLVSK